MNSVEHSCKVCFASFEIFAVGGRICFMILPTFAIGSNLSCSSSIFSVSLASKLDLLKNRHVACVDYVASMLIYIDILPKWLVYWFSKSHQILRSKPLDIILGPLQEIFYYNYLICMERKTTHIQVNSQMFEDIYMSIYICICMFLCAYETCYVHITIVDIYIAGQGVSPWSSWYILCKCLARDMILVMSQHQGLGGSMFQILTAKYSDKVLLHLLLVLKLLMMSIGVST